MNIIYCPLSNKDEGINIARTLVQEKLASCCNIIPKVISIYTWENKIEQSEESVLIVKTIRTQKTVEKIKKLHSYQTPAILTIKNIETNQEFINYIKSL